MKCLRSLSLLALGAMSAITSNAKTEGVMLPEDNVSFCEWLSNWNKLYKAKEGKNPIIQEFNASLRMQYQIGWVDPNGNGKPVGTKGGGYNDEFRRFRLGMNAKMFNGKLKLVNIWNVGGVDGRRELDNKTNKWANKDTTSSLYELYAEYTTEPAIYSLGMMKPVMTTEYRTSSSAILTVERSVLVNQLRAETNYGIQAKNSGKDDKIGWLTGVYLNGVDGGKRMDTPEFNSTQGAFAMAQASYDTSGFITKKGRVFLDYAHNFTDYIGKNAPKTYAQDTTSYRGTGAEDIIALSWDMNEGPWSFVTELMGGFNVANNSNKQAQNVMGFVFMPSYKFNPNWEAVLRYQYAKGDDAIKTEGRYITANTTAASTCDSLNALYLGLNYYICESNPNMMKIMTGMEYSHYDNTSGASRDNKAFKGWSYYVSFRTNF